MQHDDSKALQEASLLGRIFSLEAVLMLMGFVCLIYGLINRVETSILFGIIIIPAVFILHRVKKKDWKAHWAQVEEEQRQRERNSGKS